MSKCLKMKKTVTTPLNMKTAQNIKVELNEDVESLMTTQTKIKLKMENVGYHTKLLVMSASFSLPQSSHS